MPSSRAETDAAALVVATGRLDGEAAARGRWGPATVLDHVLQTVHDAALESVVVVIGPQAESILERFDPGNATVVIDPEWDEGPAASIRCGLDELARSGVANEAVLLSVLQPQVEAEVITSVVRGRREAGKPAAMPKYRYATGLPFVIHRELWPRAMGMEGEATVEALLKAHPEWVHEVWIDRLQPATVTTRDELSAIAPRA